GTSLSVLYTLSLHDALPIFTDGGEVLDLVVGDAHGELLLGERDDRHHRQRVDVQVVGEGLVELDRVGRQTGLLADNLGQPFEDLDRKSTRLNSSHVKISYAV